MCCFQAFLHRHNRPQLSLHEEMVRREREREAEERQREQAEFEASRLKEEQRVKYKCVYATYTHACMHTHQHKQLEEELRQRMSHHTLRGSDEESDSEESQKSLPPQLLSTSLPTLPPHTITTLPPSLGTPRNLPKRIQADPSDNPSGQLSNPIDGVGRGRLSRQIHMQRGKCLGEIEPRPL